MRCEWTQDWYGFDYPSGSVTDPIGAESGSLRVERGGDCYDGTYRAAVSFRYGNSPESPG